MKTEPIYNEIFYVWCAPDGSMQLSLIGPDLATCLAVPKVLNGAQSVKELKAKGFYIQKVNVSITPIEDAEKIEIANALKKWQ